MHRSFSQIFWGLLLVILDLKINRIDLLPDFIGYTFVALGCGTLGSISRRFDTASKLNWILVIAAIWALLSAGRFPVAIKYVYATLDCLMIWFLMGGIIDLSISRSRSDLAVSANNRRVAYATIVAVATLIPLLVGNFRDGAVVLLIIVIGAMLVLLTLMLHIIHRVQVELTDD